MGSSSIIINITSLAERLAGDSSNLLCNVHESEYDESIVWLEEHISFGQASGVAWGIQRALDTQDPKKAYWPYGDSGSWWGETFEEGKKHRPSDEAGRIAARVVEKATGIIDRRNQRVRDAALRKEREVRLQRMGL